MLTWVKKYNPYHDDKGEFSSADGHGTGKDQSFRLVDMSAVRNDPDQFQADANNVGDAITPWDKLSEQETNAITEYALRGYFDHINEPLREGKTPEELVRPINPYTNSARIAGMNTTKDVIDAMDSAIAKNSLPENLTLFRGINNWPKALGTDDESKLVGLTFQDKGFVSTSVEQSRAVEFGSFLKDKYNTVIQIEAPKGQHAVAVTPNFPFEEEVILPRGSQFKITSVEHQTVTDTNGFKHDMRKIVCEPVSVAKSELQLIAKASKSDKFIWQAGDIQVSVRKDAPVAGDNDPPASPAINGPGFSWHKLPQQKEITEKRKTPKILVGAFLIKPSASYPNPGISKFDAGQERDDHGRWSYEGPSVKSLFRDNLGYKRSEMPQIPDGKLKSEFIAGLKQSGVSVKEETVPARSLKPTQKEFNEQNIEGLREAFDKGEYRPTNRILISKDHRVLDGHHRWAMLAQKNQPVEAIRIGLPMAKLMPLALKFDSAHRVEHESVKQHDVKKWEQFEELETVLKDDSSDGAEPAEYNDADGRPKWMQAPGQGGKDPVYRSQKPGPNGNNDSLFAKNVNDKPKVTAPVDPDAYYIW